MLFRSVGQTAGGDASCAGRRGRIVVAADQAIEVGAAAGEDGEATGREGLEERTATQVEAEEASPPIDGPGFGGGFANAIGRPQE